MDSQQHRLECEARYWLARGVDQSSSQLEAFKAKIKSKRGQAGLDTLLEEMRRQWRIKRDEQLSPE